MSNASIEGNIFVWRHGRSEVTLTRDGDAWSVVYSSAGRLIGPRQVVYQEKHKRAAYAAWDVMARVIRVCRDEDEGLDVARKAAQWMRATGSVDERDD